MAKLYIAEDKTHKHPCYEVYMLIADTGEKLEQHCCSCKGFAMGDLAGEHQVERHATWKKMFGKYQVSHLGDDDMTEERLMALYKKWCKSQKKTGSKK